MTTNRTISIFIAIFSNVLNGLSFVVQKIAHKRRGESSYLKEPLWYIGTAINITGELGNFIAYAMAPAVIVAPLGSIGVLSNAIASRIHLKEQIRPLAWLGILLCIAGSVGVVFSVPHSSNSSSISSSNQSATIDPNGTWARITTVKFSLFIMFHVCALVVLIPVKEPKSDENVLYYVYLCSVLSSMLIVSAKGVATFLSMAIMGGQPKLVFASSLFWVFILWVIFCLLLQGRYFNEALTKYNSSKLIPTYFVLYVFAGIVGSIILYDELSGITWLQLALFCASCITTFVGVFLVS